ncbi:hypothetical protein CEP54_015168 [Fusarium duplospermum]|uniref:Uncharacterized protein n=1 Tax=Fusarium duplospermum TaxID=1325734 RepID=A0A428NR10_9HYPO|nr:hypothetical protein CEP54_015168 [Fusarium duplospermum]
MAALLAIFRTSPEKLKMGLEHGYYMTIKGLGGIVGSNHAMVLKMWSHYITSLGQDTFPKGDDWDKSRGNIHLAGLYGYVAHQNDHRCRKPQQLSSFLAKNLESRSYGGLCSGSQAEGEDKPKASCNPDYDSVAVEAYVFSTNLLAKKLYQRANLAFSLELLDEAIDLLKHGNTECLIWAAMFSKNRLRLLEDAKDPIPSKPEKHRMLELRSRLTMIKVANFNQSLECSGTSERITFLRLRRKTAKGEMFEDLRSMLDDLKLS